MNTPSLAFDDDTKDVIAGHHTNITCSVHIDSYPVPNITWWKANNPGGSDTEITDPKIDWEDSSVPPEEGRKSTLMFMPSRDDNSDELWCRAQQNGRLSEDSVRTQLDVKCELY